MSVSTKWSPLLTTFIGLGNCRSLRRKPKIASSASKQVKIQFLSYLKSKKDTLPPNKTVNEEIQLDFLGPLNNEKGHKQFILVAIDNCSKWIWTKVTRACNTKTAIRLLNRIKDESGVPQSIKTDNATAFTSRKFQDTVNRFHIIHRFSTPYVHAPIGTVERKIRTEEYVFRICIPKNTYALSYLKITI